MANSSWDYRVDLAHSGQPTGMNRHHNACLAASSWVTRLKASHPQGWDHQNSHIQVPSDGDATAIQLPFFADMDRFMYKVAEKQIKDQQLRASHSDTRLVSVVHAKESNQTSACRGQLLPHRTLFGFQNPFVVTKSSITRHA